MKTTPYILLVEDNEQDEVLTIKALRKNKVLNEIVVARDGEEAIDILLNNSHPKFIKDLPQIVLLDLKIPKVDGLEVLKHIRANPRTHILPVVVLTTSKEESDLVASYTLGANSYVRKPVDFHEFTDVVKGLGIYWLILNERAPIA